jgi:S1-C subfamily serine protease
MFPSSRRAKLLAAWLLAVVLMLRCGTAAELISADQLAVVKATEAARIASIEKVYGSVVAIYGNDRQGGGSGVLYDPDGYALTNYHVVNAAGKDGWAGLADGKLYRWKLIGLDPGGDVAIIRLEGQDKFPVAALGDSSAVRVGDWAMAMGNPFVLAEDQKPTVTLGIVSGVKRFQPGAGKNMLVYGNCIQVDSSINPGNSGGPLFNLQSEVIGINGRGSFKERGRVNVGVGYAISMEQIRTFIPELLATKIAQHGTLDAVFTNRIGGVICSKINLDSTIARLGLELGDRLVSFNGRKITDANQFTNDLSMLPAGWPVQVGFQQGQGTRHVWLRLDALPYGSTKKTPARPKKIPPGRQLPIKPKMSLDKPGVVRDAKVNRRESARVLRDWGRFALGEKRLNKVPAYRFEEDIYEGGKKTGSQTVIRGLDGRFRVEQTSGELPKTTGWDGQVYWSQQAGDKAAKLDAAKAPSGDHLGQGVALGPLAGEKAVEHFAKIELEGADRSQNRRAYRLRTEDKQGRRRYLWFSMYDAMGRPQVQLLKTSAGRDGDPADRTMTYLDYRDVEGVQIPHRRRQVQRLYEGNMKEFVVTKCEPIVELAKDAFAMPTDTKTK